jgi:hypothetical protein
MDKVSVWPHPVCDIEWEAEMRDAFSRSKAPIRDLPGEPWFFLAEQPLANAGMYSVRPDKEIAALGRAILKVGGHAAFVLLDVDQTSSKLDVLGTERFGQKGDEVSPVEMVVGSPVLALDGVAQFFAPQEATVLPATKDDRGGTDRDPRHSLAKPVAAKQTGSVRADLNARPDLALRDGLLKQRNLETGPTQRNSGGHASDAGADHQTMKTFHRATSRMRGISEDSFETIRRLALSQRTRAVMPESPLAPIQSLARTVVPQLVENASSNSARSLDDQSLTKLMAASEPNGGDASGPPTSRTPRSTGK